MMKYLKKLECISERVFKIEIQMEKNKKIMSNNCVQTKDEFWEKATEVLESCTGRIMVMGDLNRRVGIKNDKSDVIGKYGKIVCYPAFGCASVPPSQVTRSQEKQPTLKQPGSIQCEPNSTVLQIIVQEQSD
ncbi:hypothetical protein FQA39_LY03604 [Lamprigera yunnana]|nr:hypothetical protein FQA39_LY03604 [Lamprigera yunnana]